MTSLGTPHPHLDLSLCPVVQKVIDVISPPHLVAPVVKETFTSSDDACDCLQDWVFSQGFAIVS